MTGQPFGGSSQRKWYWKRRLCADLYADGAWSCVCNACYSKTGCYAFVSIWWICSERTVHKNQPCWGVYNILKNMPLPVYRMTRLTHDLVFLLLQPKVIISANLGIEPGRNVLYKPLLDKAIEMSSSKPSTCIILQRSKGLHGVEVRVVNVRGFC